jgi:hypothetical protein
MERWGGHFPVSHAQTLLWRKQTQFSVLTRCLDVDINQNQMGNRRRMFKPPDAPRSLGGVKLTLFLVIPGLFRFVGAFV